MLSWPSILIRGTVSSARRRKQRQHGEEKRCKPWTGGRSAEVKSHATNRSIPQVLIDPQRGRGQELGGARPVASQHSSRVPRCKWKSLRHGAAAPFNLESSCTASFRSKRICDTKYRQ